MWPVKLSALIVATVAMTASAAAQPGYLQISGQNFSEINKLEREFDEKLDKERWDCRKKRGEAKNREERNKAQMECREKFDDLEREYRKKLREERQKFYE